MDDADRLRRKREYIRNFMQEYRGKQRKCKEALQAQIHRLEARVARYRKQTGLADDNTGASSDMLPWKDVARGLYDLRCEAMVDHRDLASRVREYEHILAEMRAFVVASTLLQKSPSTHVATWRDVTLLTHPTSRRLGKIWITQQMYHNTDRVFEQYGLPSHTSRAPYNSMDMAFTGDDGHHFVQKAHLTWDDSLETTVRLYREHTGSMFTLDGFYPMHSQTRVEIMEHTTLHQYVRPDGWNMHLLCGEFHDADRTVLVVQHVQTDEGHRCRRGRQRGRMTWTELRRESPTVTRERFLCILSHEIDQDGTPVGLDESARRWSFPLTHAMDDCERERLFLKAFRAMNVALKVQRSRWYQGLVAAVQQEDASQEREAPVKCRLHLR